MEINYIGMNGGLTFRIGTSLLKYIEILQKKIKKYKKEKEKERKKERKKVKMTKCTNGHNGCKDIQGQ